MMRRFVAVGIVLIAAFQAPLGHAAPRVCQVQIRFDFSPGLSSAITSGDVTTSYSRLCFYPAGGDPDITSWSGASDYVGNCAAATLDVNGPSTNLIGVMIGGSVSLMTQPGVYVLVPKNPCQSSPFATGVGIGADNAG